MWCLQWFLTGILRLQSLSCWACCGRRRGRAPGRADASNPQCQLRVLGCWLGRTGYFKMWFKICFGETGFLLLFIHGSPCWLIDRTSFVCYFLTLTVVVIMVSVCSSSSDTVLRSVSHRKDKPILFLTHFWGNSSVAWLFVWLSHISSTSWGLTAGSNPGAQVDQRGCVWCHDSKWKHLTGLRLDDEGGCDERWLPCEFTDSVTQNVCVCVWAPHPLWETEYPVQSFPVTSGSFFVHFCLRRWTATSGKKAKKKKKLLQPNPGSTWSKALTWSQWISRHWCFLDQSFLLSSSQ